MKKLLFLFSYLWIVSAAEVNETEVCPICIEAYSSGCEPHQVTCCNKKFCIICLSKMLSYGQRNCPFCRQPSIYAESVPSIDRNDDDNIIEAAAWTEFEGTSLLIPLRSNVSNQFSDYIQCPTCHTRIHFYNFKAHQLHCD